MGKIYDIFFTGNVPYNLPQRMGKDSSGSVLTVLDLGLHIGDIGYDLLEARPGIIRSGYELYGISGIDSMTHMYELRD